MSYIGTSILLNGAISPLCEQKPIQFEGEIYEVFRVINGNPIFLNDHLMRLNNTLSTSGKFATIDPLAWEKSIEWLILCNPIQNGNIRISIGGEGIQQAGFIRAVYPSNQMVTDGVKCTLLHHTRQQPNEKMYHHALKDKASENQKQNWYESILVNAHNQITEGSRSNLFFWKSGVLITAPDNAVLQGIIRKKVLEIARSLEIPVRFEALPVEALSQMDGVFLTGTSPHILPVAAIDSHVFQPKHPLTQKLQSALKQYIENK